MNKLFYYRYIEAINGERTGSSGSSYHYGEPDDSKIINRLITDFNTLYNSDLSLQHAYRDKTLFKHRPVIRYQNKYVSEKDFTEYLLTTEIQEVVYKLTMEDLMHELSTEEFALWCIDHGMSICPMNK